MEALAGALRWLTSGPAPAGRARPLPVADVRAAAARAGLREGDCIARLNGAVPIDVLDLEMAAADGALWLTVLRDGRPLDLVVEPRRGEWHGISLGHDGLGAPPRVCRNRCRFCFVDQVPAGLRAALSVKDDDYRLSFLHGNFVTLSNLGEDDVARIVRLRVSPLFVSLHAWDDDARVALMGEPARRSRAILERLAAEGIELHLQVVLCPGWNDGDTLLETVDRTQELAAVADVGVVPVSLAAEGDLRRATRADAEVLVAALEERQARSRAARGTDFVHAADELYLLAGRLPPAGDAPLQYENGIGMSAELLAEAARLAEGTEADTEDFGAAVAATDACDQATSIRLALRHAGRAGASASRRAARRAGSRRGRSPVRNRLFGPHVTVTGLLGGEEVLDALRDEPLAAGEYLVAPRSFLPEQSGTTLDDVSEADLEAACGGRLVVAHSLGEAFARLCR